MSPRVLPVPASAALGLKTTPAFLLLSWKSIFSRTSILLTELSPSPGLLFIPDRVIFMTVEALYVFWI